MSADVTVHIWRRTATDGSEGLTWCGRGYPHMSDRFSSGSDSEASCLECVRGLIESLRMKSRVLEALLPVERRLSKLSQQRRRKA